MLLLHQMLKTLIETSGSTGSDMAKACGLDRALVSRWLNGKRCFAEKESVKYTKTLAEFFCKEYEKNQSWPSLGESFPLVYGWHNASLRQDFLADMLKYSQFYSARAADPHQIGSLTEEFNFYFAKGFASILRLLCYLLASREPTPVIYCSLDWSLLYSQIEARELILMPLQPQKNCSSTFYQYGSACINPEVHQILTSLFDLREKPTESLDDALLYIPEKFLAFMNCLDTNLPLFVYANVKLLLSSYQAYFDHLEVKADVKF